VRLLGRLAPPAADGGRSRADDGRSAATEEGRGMPNDRRLIPLSRLGTSDAASEVPSANDPRLLLGRLMLLRIVTDAGKLSFSSALVLGDPLGVRSLFGAGNFDLAECTRSSIFCILPRRFLIWYSESDLGKGSVPVRLGREVTRGRGGGLMAFASDVDMPALEAVDGPRECFGTAREVCTAARGVGGMSDLRFPGTGVFGSGFTSPFASESGGDGGVGASDALSDLGGGVDAIGEGGVMPLASLAGLLARRLSTASGLGFLDRSLSIVSSAVRSFSSVISLSTFRSPSSSRSR
jgi:hypothetical protein